MNSEITSSRRRAVLVATAALALVAGGLATVGTAAASTATPAAAPAGTVGSVPLGHAPTRRLCSAPTRKHQLACLALARTDLNGKIGLLAAAPSGLGPADIKSAYALPTGGNGQTVAIVDAMDDPNAETDLTTYRSQYGLPPCSTANGCFRKVNQRGGTTPPAADAGWAGEISLDLDAVSAACPSCKILLVESDSATTDSLGTAVNQAVTLGAKYVSNSYGGGEDSSETSTDTAYYKHPGVVVTVSSGDNGLGAEYPASSRWVTSVGGTALRRASNTRGWTETVWGSGASSGQNGGAGSGCSTYEAKQSWQTDTGCTKRTIADVAAVADPATGLATYDTYQSPGWQVYGGTSLSSPLVAAMYALAGPPATTDYPTSYPYAHTSAFNDVTAGSNGSCGNTYLCTGKTGYDGPTGVGTPNGISGLKSGGSTTPPPPTGKHFENATRVNIPDNGAAVTSAITVTGVTGKAPSALKVGVDIKHTYIGDLTVDLVAPSGKVYNLHNRTGGGTANLGTTYTVNASSEVANGTWKLRVQDHEAVDTGYVNKFSLEF